MKRMFAVVRRPVICLLLIMGGVLALCGLLARPVIAKAENSQTLVVDGDTLVVQMVEPLSAGLQTLVVDGDTLTVQVLVESLPEDASSLATRDKRLVGPAQAESDSLSEKMEAIANRNLRIAKKVAVGTLSGLTTTLVAVWVQDKVLEPTGDPDTDAWRSISFNFVGAAIGLSIGFPLGVTLVDPCDSFSNTLLAGVIPGMIGMPLLSPFTSLYASEKWRKPPESLRVSFGLASTFNGSLSAVAQLRF